MSTISIKTNFKDLDPTLSSSVDALDYIDHSFQASDETFTLAEQLNFALPQYLGIFNIATQVEFQAVLNPDNNQPAFYTDSRDGKKYWLIDDASGSFTGAVSITQSQLPAFMRGVPPAPNSTQTMTITGLDLTSFDAQDQSTQYSLSGSIIITYHFDASGVFDHSVIANNSTINKISGPSPVLGLGFDPNSTSETNLSLTYNSGTDTWAGGITSIETRTFIPGDNSIENQFVFAEQEEVFTFASAVALNTANPDWISTNNTTAISSYRLKLDQTTRIFNPVTLTSTSTTKNLSDETVTALPTSLNVNSILSGNFFSNNFVTGNDTITLTSTGNINDPFNNAIAPNLVDGGAGNDTITGSEFNDVINGNEGNDTLKGAGGDDILDGGTGTNTLDGGLGSDTASFANAFETYAVSKTTTSVTLTDATSTTTVTNVENFSFGLNTPLTLQEVLATASSTGDDVLFKIGSGTFANNAFTQTEGYSGPAAVFDGGLGNDKLFGTDFDDSLVGGDGIDTLVGYAGNDFLDGGVGADTLNGGNGADLYVVDNIADVIQEGVSQTTNLAGLVTDRATLDTIQVKGAISYVLAANQAIGVLSAGLATKVNGAWSWDYSNSVSATNIKGNEYGQYLIGNGAANKLEGLLGDDVLSGEAGADILDGGDGNDVLLLGAGNDSLLGGNGDDSFYQYETLDQLTNPGSNSATGRDSIDGGVGNDTLYLLKAESEYNLSKSGTDLVFTDKNNAQTVITVKNNIEFIAFQGATPIAFSDFSASAASALDDVLYARGTGTYNFSTQVFTPDDTFSPSGNLPTIDGLAGNDKLYGSAYADILVGGLGNDFLNGFAGADNLSGGDGNDTLVVTPANTLPASLVAIELNGGAGDDTYLVDGFDAQQRIHITDVSGKDTLVINEYGYRNAGGVITPTFSHTYPVIENNNLVIYANSGPSILIPLITAATGAIERVKVNQYNDPNNLGRVTRTLDLNMVYATLDSVSRNWVAKGTIGADAILAFDDNNAATNDGNVYDGGKGDDLIWFNNSSNSVIMGGEGFNKLSLYSPISTGQAPEVAQNTSQETLKATLSYAWAVGSAEVNLLAGVGLAYDATGQDIVGFDEFSGFANVLGSKQGDIIIGDASANRLDGSDGNDNLSGGGGNDVLIGGKGDDRLEVGSDSSGFDFVQLLGSEGNDTYYAGLNAAAVVVSERNGGVATYGGSSGQPGNVTYGALSLSGGTDAGGIDTLVIGGIQSLENFGFDVSGNVVGLGLVSSDANGVLPDTVNVSLLVDRAIEKIAFDLGSGSGTVYSTTWSNIGTRSADLIVATPTSSFEYGGQGDDLIIGSSSNDFLSGGNGNDILYGRQGADRLLGNSGNDTLYVNAGDGDIAMGGAGSDVYVLKNRSSSFDNEVSRILDYRASEDFLKFEGVDGIRVTLENGITDTKGNIGGGNFADVHINAQGYVTVNEQGDPAGLQILSNELQVIGLVGINNQQGFDALMDHFVFSA